MTNEINPPLPGKTGGVYGAKARLGNRATSYLVFICLNLIPPKDREIYKME
ncbi:hypothetical protein [Nostoc sp. MS1]|uniref:hypothetical protein n=1 Tax=Nostoc sp. MS1 TaxID=2764711 RepID=UPI001CC6DD85|nr:hypothetical protein [Nostoc sp. MS1]BCL38371.1 hypothetical protein NSMS1_48180 [Nostoc sp. MS1]